MAAPFLPITLEQRAEVIRLRDQERRPWAFIAHTLRRREETLRCWYERDKAEAALSFAA